MEYIRITFFSFSRSMCSLGWQTHTHNGLDTKESIHKAKGPPIRNEMMSSRFKTTVHNVQDFLNGHPNIYL